jgi:DNA helicase IV
MDRIAGKYKDLLD